MKHRSSYLSLCIPNKNTGWLRWKEKASTECVLKFSYMEHFGSEHWGPEKWQSRKINYPVAIYPSYFRFSRDKLHLPWHINKLSISRTVDLFIRFCSGILALSVFLVCLQLLRNPQAPQRNSYKKQSEEKCERSLQNQNCGELTFTPVLDSSQTGKEPHAIAHPLLHQWDWGKNWKSKRWKYCGLT